MNTRSILVRFPGLPFTFDTLLPDRHLAMLAGALFEAGHATEIRDYGTVEVLDRLFPLRARESLERLVDQRSDAAVSADAFGAVLPRRLTRAFAIRRQQLCAAVVDELASESSLDFVAFSVHRREDWPGVRQIAQRLREERPSLRLVATGAWVDEYAEILVESEGVDVFDGLFVGDAEAALSAWADRMDRPDTWAAVPNLVVPLSGRDQSLERDTSYSLDALPEPAYAADVYPALHEAGKLRLFAVEDSRGCGETCHGCAQPALSGSDVRLRSATATCDAIARLGRRYGARAFHFVSSGTPAVHAEAVAQALRVRRVAAIYSRPIQLSYAGPGLAAVLHASGCQVCSVRVDTGSQRLLDDYYARGFTVSPAEQVVRALVAQDIFTVTRFVYPCPVDDYHSRAETVRLVNRTRPHAVTIDLPGLSPGSNWYAWAADFGFRVAPHKYRRWVVDGTAGWPGCASADAGLPYRVGERSAKALVHEHADLVAEIRELKIPTHVDPLTALVARVAGHAGREPEFSRQAARHFLTGDAAGLATQVAAFNCRACVPLNTLVCRPFTPVDLAVGN